MKVSFIVNPRAGRGSVEKKLRSALEGFGLDYAILTTEGPRHATELARNAANESDIVAAVGGDGTVHEVAAGLISAGGRADLAVIPMGTGNDFVKMFDVPRDLSSAIRVVMECPPTRVDYGRVRWSGPDGDGSDIFVNLAGAGIDAMIASAASRMKWLSGTLRYVAAVLTTLRSWSAPLVAVELKSNGWIGQNRESETLLVGACNGKCAAGGFYLTPKASVTDGKLDAFIVQNASAARVLRLVPKVLRGRHVGEREVMIERVDSMVVRPAVPVAVEADGEILTRAATEIHFEVVPGGLPVRMPVKT